MVNCGSKVEPATLPVTLVNRRVPPAGSRTLKEYFFTEVKVKEYSVLAFVRVREAKVAAIALGRSATTTAVSVDVGDVLAGLIDARLRRQTAQRARGCHTGSIRFVVG